MGNVIYIIYSVCLIGIIVIVLSGIKVSKRLVSFFVILIVVLLLVANISEELGSLIILVGLIAIVYYETRYIFRSIIYVLGSMSILIIVDSILGYIIVQFNVLENMKDIRKPEFLWLYVLDSVFIGIISFLIGYLLNKFINRRRINAISKSLAIILLSSLVYMFAILFINAFYIDNLANYRLVSLITNIFIFIAFSIEVILVVRGQNFENERLRKATELNQLSEYTESVEVLYKQMRKFKHDYVNILTSMTGYMREDDMEGLIQYYSKNIEPFNIRTKMDQFRLGSLANIKVVEIKGIVSNKLIMARDEGIDVIIEVQEVIEKIEMKTIDLVRCVGILLDNAIEAAGKCDEPSLNFAMIKGDNSIVIQVENSTVDQEINVKKIFEDGYSSKEEGRGIGLHNYKMMVDQYSNILTETYVKETVFSQTMTIMDKEGIGC